MSIRTLLTIALVAYAFAFPAAAHHVAKSGIPRGPAANAPMSIVTGYVDEITIDNRAAGTMSRIPVLIADDGSRYVLGGATASAVTAGAAYTLTGRANGRALFVETTQMNALADARRANAAAVPATTLAGTLRLGHADNFDGTPSEFFYAIVTDTQQYRISLATLLDGLENGMRADVSGRVGPDGELFADVIVIVGPPERKTKAEIAPNAVVTTSYLVMPVKFPTNAAAPFVYNADPFTVASLANAVFGAAPINSAAAYYAETSYGQQLLSGAVADNGSGGWLLANRAVPATCDINAIASAAETAATARGYNVASYPGRIYVFSNNVPGCGWSGLAYVGWARSWIKQSTSLLVIGHELGHNFGLLHAASLDCGANVIGGTCTSAEYGDPFDIMGNQRAMHFNSAQKFELGWIPPTAVRTHVSGAATYTLNPLESPGGTTYAVKIPAAANRTYWLEYRQPIGFDSALSAYPNNGVQLRVAAPFESICAGCSDDTEFLDVTPATATFTDGTLVAGQSYTDATYGFMVSVTGASPTALTLNVTALGEALKPDFNFSGTTDLVWRHAPSGQTAVWLMNGAGPTASGVISGDGAWTVTGIGDFSGDTKSDLVWRSSAGATGIWLMNGLSPAATGILSGDPSWTISNAADFNGDGKADVVWRSASGATAIWLMNSLVASASAVLSGDPSWTVVKTGDFNGDGKADLLWRSAAGATALWLMNGTSATSTAVIGADPAWQVVEVGDFNGDGKDDLIWRSATGVTVVWLMNGTASIATGVLSTNASEDFGHARDFDGDGKFDLIVRNSSTGATSLWVMNGATVSTKSTISTSSAMQVVGVGDYNGDGRADLVWRNSATGATSAWLMNGASVLSTTTWSSDPNWSATFPGQ